MELTNSSIPHPRVARPAPPGLAQAAPVAVRLGLAPAPALLRQFQASQSSLPVSLVAPPRQAARDRVIRSLRRPEPPTRLDYATPGDLEAILGLIEEASRWLKAQGKDQWAEPWPNREQRDARVLRGLVNKKTVIVRQGDSAVATVTMANWHNPDVWVQGACECDLAERAIYLHRLITARRYAGRGLGELLINWAAERARARYGAKWIRIDVWTTNTDLHRYYQRLGFESCGSCPDLFYPSGALFQRPLARERVCLAR